jgi:hypothetical protein
VSRVPTSFLDRRPSRRALLRGFGVGGAGLAGAILIGCSDDDDDATATPTEEMMDDEPSATATEEMMDDEPSATATEEMMDPMSLPDADLGAAQDFTLVNGWYRDEPVVYYDFGMNSTTNGAAVVPAPIWAFITGMDSDGNPIFVEGQHNIVDVIPGDAGYSDLWQVNLVTVGEDYEANSIHSRADLEAMSYPTTAPGLLVNCPIVPAGSTFENGEELVTGWYQDQRVFYPDFGANPAVAIPIFAFITGMDDDGNPIFVEGQNNIIDSLPGDDGYSAFWLVNLVVVDDTYEANSITSAQGVVDSGFEILQPGLVVNCPVVERA